MLLGGMDMLFYRCRKFSTERKKETQKERNQETKNDRQIRLDHVLRPINHRNTERKRQIYTNKQKQINKRDEEETVSVRLFAIIIISVCLKCNMNFILFVVYWISKLLFALLSHCPCPLGCTYISCQFVVRPIYIYIYLSLACVSSSIFFSE